MLCEMQWGLPQHIEVKLASRAGSTMSHVSPAHIRISSQQKLLGATGGTPGSRVKPAQSESRSHWL